MHLMHKEKTYLNDNLDTGFCVSFTLHIFPYQQYTMAEFLIVVQRYWSLLSSSLITAAKPHSIHLQKGHFEIDWALVVFFVV